MSGALFELGARDLLAGFRARSFSPVEVLDELAGRIEELAPLGAFTTTCLDRAREEAFEAEAAYARGGAGPLAGIPFGARVLFDSARVRTTYGSPMFADPVPAADAEAIRRARAAG